MPFTAPPADSASFDPDECNKFTADIAEDSSGKIQIHLKVCLLMERKRCTVSFVNMCVEPGFQRSAFLHCLYQMGCMPHSSEIRIRFQSLYQKTVLIAPQSKGAGIAPVPDPDKISGTILREKIVGQELPELIFRKKELFDFRFIRGASAPYRALYARYSFISFPKSRSRIFSAISNSHGESIASAFPSVCGRRAL